MESNTVSTTATFQCVLKSETVHSLYVRSREKGTASSFGLELMENGSPGSIITLGVPQRGRGPVTVFPENIMLLLSIALLIALDITASPIIYELYEKSKGVSRPSLDSVTGTYSNSD